MSAFKDMTELCEWLEKKHPSIWKLCYPRAYVPPAGYPSPRWHAAILASHFFSNDGRDLNKTMVDYLLADWKLVELGVPTVFVGADFVSALTMTDPPLDFKLGDLKWPDEAICFVLPESFQKEYFGRPVPFIRTARIPVGNTPPPKIVDEVIPQGWGGGLGYPGSDMGFVCSGPVFFDERPVDYSASYSMANKVGDILESESFDLSNQERVFHYTKGQSTLEEDLVIVKKICMVAIQLILAMTALPQYVERETQLRPEKIKHGKRTQVALWRPKIFGGKYILQRKRKGPSDGTHASPRLHRRSGHWRNQKYGAGRTESKLLWIEPMWVGVKDHAKDAANQEGKENDKKNP